MVFLSFQSTTLILALVAVLSFNPSTVISNAKQQHHVASNHGHFNSNSRNKTKLDSLEHGHVKNPDAIPGSCPEYSSYSLSRHPPYTDTELRLPFMRPTRECRTFNSSAVEKIINDLRGKWKDEDLGRIFENGFPQTLDTTIKWRNENLTFVVTGDINAEWLRDTFNQLNVYLAAVPEDKELKNLIRGTINLQSRYISRDPNCGSFQPPEESGLPPQHNGAADGAVVSPPYNNNTVFECKLELDSLGAFIALSTRYYEVTKDDSFVTTGKDSWVEAITKILDLFEAQQLATVGDDGYVQSEYNFTSTVDVVINNGVGPPQLNTGLIGTSFRPSDDKIVMRQNIPDNAFVAVQLENLSPFLSSHGQHKLANRAAKLAVIVRDAIAKWGVIEHPVWGHVYAYEVDGYGSRLIMDDANVPSLLSLPYLGFTDLYDPIYQRTRRMVLNVKGNPYYNKGEFGAAIGSPHTGIGHVWHMGLISQIVTTESEREIEEALNTIKTTTSGLGLIHESFYTHNATEFTRNWFAWANAYYAQALLFLAEARPSLILKDDKPYVLPYPISQLTPGVGDKLAGGKHDRRFQVSPKNVWKNDF